MQGATPDTETPELPVVVSADTMQAIVCPTYGSPDVLELAERAKPSPGEGEVLVRVRASSVNAGDWHLMRGDPWLVRLMMGLFKPKYPVLGADIAGVVEAVGPGTTQFGVGDEVFGDISEEGFGAFAQYVAVPERVLAAKPTSLSFEQAAAVPAAAVTALHGLRDHGRIAAGQQVLIHGASGGVGSFAVQIAKALGAEVTAVCSTKNVEAVTALGADRVIDYKTEDFTAREEKYDLILTLGGARSIFEYRRALKPTGTHVQGGGEMKQFWQTMLLGPVLSRKAGKRFTTYLVHPNGDDLRFLTPFLEDGRITPAIESTYPLERVADAVGHLEDGHPHGKIVVAIP